MTSLNLLQLNLEKIGEEKNKTKKKVILENKKKKSLWSKVHLGYETDENKPVTNQWQKEDLRKRITLSAFCSTLGTVFKLGWGFIFWIDDILLII